MTYDEAKELSDKIASDKAKREQIITAFDVEGLVEDFEWSEREASRCDFLNDRERKIYRNALFNAMKWGKQNQ